MSHNISLSGVKYQKAQRLFVINKFRCPSCGSRTITWRRGSRWPGIWECLNEACGTTDSCEHQKTHVETTEDWPTSPLDNPQPYDVYVCDACDETIPLYERDPQLERLEAAYDD